MPYKSDKQRRYLHSQEPEVAAKFDREERKTKRKGSSRGSSRRRSGRR